MSGHNANAIRPSERRDTLTILCRCLTVLEASLDNEIQVQDQIIDKLTPFVRPNEEPNINWISFWILTELQEYRSRVETAERHVRVSEEAVLRPNELKEELMETRDAT